MELKNSLDNNLYALILAGGVGSRFWPFSRELEPKQFLKITGEKSLLEDTISRLDGVVLPQNIYIISNQQYFFEIEKHINGFGIPVTNIISEPQGKNTAPAIGLGIKLVIEKNKDGDPSFIILPADHYIKNSDEFKKCLKSAVAAARDNYLVTIGIKPSKPATGYGYIKVRHQLPVTSHQLREKNKKKEYYKVEKFLEKPGLAKAKEYITSKSYFWNSGIFVWKAAVFMQELQRYLPDLYRQLSAIKKPVDLARVWEKVRPVSVDYGILEHSKKIALVPAAFDWSDLGAWDALGEVLGKNIKGNIVQADSVDYLSQGLCVFSRGNRLIGTIGLKNLIIADTPDALLVCNRDQAQDVKHIVEHLKSSNRKEHIVHTQDKRPWGSYTVLQALPGFKIKLVEIEPGKRLSLQLHKKRAEHWVVVSGRAKVTRGNMVKFVNSNESIYIPRGLKHRLENPTKLTLRIVEVQTGDYLEEDDIKRFADSFNRK